MDKHNVVYGEESYPDGYYLSDIESAGYDDYLSEMLEKLKDMEVGEIAYLESDYGYHIIMRYELDAGRFGDSLYKEWFEGLDSALINKLFLAKCEDVIKDISENEGNLGKAKSIKDIGINFDY